MSQPVSPFAALQSLTTREKSIRLVDPDDVLSRTPQWSAEQMKMDPEFRQAPANGYRIETRPGAPVFDFKVRRLTSAERETCDRILDAVIPPEILEPKRVGPGEPPVEVRTGYDFDSLKYQTDLREARSKQSAMVCLYGVIGLRESIEGGDDLEKIDSLRNAIDERLIIILASEIWTATYAGGDPADFFTNASSEATPS
jgi:hypothetical protein